ncbi:MULTISPECIES: hypothetical protein [unclassified Streptococcus]|uniref:hypothetical protein n=1 Tax=unclassified Streptococcus TaxID=2608887 RepID=UPI000AF9B3CD|nr:MULTISPECIES: hypothetical protein [unclassified Streptococcus]
MNTKKLFLICGLVQIFVGLFLLFKNDNRTLGIIFMGSGVTFTALAAQEDKKK